MTRRTALDLGALLVGVVVIALNMHVVTDFAREVRKRYYRRVLFAELRPVRLTNCSLARFGNANDGGYLMCDNLLAAARSAYSYGIDGRDEWGCAIATRLRVPVHQYDCFVTTRPTCAGAAFVFHEECIGNAATDSENRVFDTLASQIGKNGDHGKRLVVKMDVEGAEWDALLTTPLAVLGRIDQLVVEFHDTDQPRFIDTLATLNKTFVVAHVHFNNITCHEGARPFPAYAYEVLFVNRTLAKVDTSEARPLLPSPLDSPNSPTLPDCQTGW